MIWLAGSDAGGVDAGVGYNRRGMRLGVVVHRSKCERRLVVSRPCHTQQCEAGGPRCHRLCRLLSRRSPVLPLFAELDSLFLWRGLHPMRLCGWHLGRSLFGSIGCNICLLAIGRGLVLSVVSCFGIVLGLYGYNSTLSINASRRNFAFS